MSIKDMVITALLVEATTKSQEMLNALDETEEHNKELLEDVEHMKCELNQKDERIEELESELEAVRLDILNGDVPDQILEVFKIAYQADPKRVSYLLNGVAGWRGVESMLAVQSWLERPRTNA
jgi:5-enolpyruvylshikimate-3-phosphate synthase